MYRREGHLVAAIQRGKEARQESFLRGREEVLAQAITSALGGGGGMERDHGVGTGYPPRVGGACVSLYPMYHSDVWYNETRVTNAFAHSREGIWAV